ncbi:SGNH/GDSL hydrolase family protein [Paenibacillus sp. LjRoot153]|uniref:SGNH/GDSL hydrolase family protein n=1 Tax=Paenibacillus sp. LjRoot153 TaxID=3342270 RepID=UPI003ED0095B
MFPKLSTIVFQGDSITDGGRSRDNDLNHVMGHGYAYLVASRIQADYPEQQISFINRGVSGNRIVDLYARWREDTLGEMPDIVSILVGVNDVHREWMNRSGVSSEKFARVYEMLLEETKEANPNVTLVLCEPFILPVGDVKANWEQWHVEITKRQRTVQEMADKYRCIHVPLQHLFSSACNSAPEPYWLWDGFHPTPAGHEMIARQWIQCVSQQMSNK